MANPISSQVWTKEAMAAYMQETLQTALVASAIADFKMGVKTIENPYPSNVSTTVNSPMTGAYTPADVGTNDESLVVATEAITSFHVRDFERVFADYDLGKTYLDLAVADLKEKIDAALLLELSNAATSEVTVTGGFTKTNILDKLAEANQYFQGYAQSLNGTFVVMDAADTVALVQAGLAAGFNFADNFLNNGFAGQTPLGHSVYVVRGTLPTDIAIAGVKGVATVGIGDKLITIEEKAVSGKTGIEYAVFTYYAAKLWNNAKPLIVKFDLA